MPCAARELEVDMTAEDREIAAEFDYYNKPGDIMMECAGRLTRQMESRFTIGTSVMGHLNVSRMTIHIENDDGRLGENIRLYGTHPSNEATKERYATLGGFKYKFAQVLKTFSKAYDDFYEEGKAVIFYTHCKLTKTLGPYQAGEKLFSVDVDLETGRTRLLGKAGPPEIIQLAPPASNVEYRSH